MDFTLITTIILGLTTIILLGVRFRDSEKFQKLLQNAFIRSKINESIAIIATEVLNKKQLEKVNKKLENAGWKLEVTKDNKGNITDIAVKSTTDDEEEEN